MTHWLTHWVTTWKQEMLAHLKSVQCSTGCKRWIISNIQTNAGCQWAAFFHLKEMMITDRPLTMRWKFWKSCHVVPRAWDASQKLRESPVTDSRAALLMSYIHRPTQIWQQVNKLCFAMMISWIKLVKKKGFPNLVFFRRFTQNNFKTYKDKLKGAHYWIKPWKVFM